MKELLLAHDLGTTGNKASLFTSGGTLLASAFHPYGTRYERPGWAERSVRLVRRSRSHAQIAARSGPGTGGRGSGVFWPDDGLPRPWTLPVTRSQMPLSGRISGPSARRNGP